VTQGWTVYFPFDQYVLVQDAQNKIQAAAQYATGTPSSTHVTVVGHTDTSGSFAYNMRLSERRAKATADQLVADGVSQSVLDVSWKGYTEPAKPTGPGVKEPLNRRSEITVYY
jgi:outer membrane protein OmpA-like peptidoglycan-associated protein